ncbi:type II toxin-antitoxin system RelE/ParE family toxin [Massilia genomosp. 1]|uniref:Type II toxin-antitoxin system mRNA interferase toxin, RelE/StbE family n=1 Tax=Massilia genomosp. 1 TaxID=2609280 RepID=A0ABX0MVV8_9BURK|nr:type II toxin-antitoxin system RelE/ParE family toxin [Massilia genomosp. 1]NHZ66626.1 type II toxin-antitoxin system mRNA interferase toxin, RelE/StbE family [Massilia genomosp. 1]
MAVKWTKKALANLAAIVDYIGQDNPDRGDSFALEIQAKVQNLAGFPGMGRPGRVMGTRELVVHENYVIPYRMTGGVVVILSVRHAAKRWPGRF